MSFFLNAVNASPGEWVFISMPDEVIHAPSTDPMPVSLSPGFRYSYSENGIGDYLGPYEAGNEVTLEDGWLVAFWAKAPSDPGKDGFYWAKIGANTYHVTVSAQSSEINPSLAVASVDVTLCEADGAFIGDAVVEIKLIGAADTNAGTVYPGIFRRKTNGSGTATFPLWANKNHASKTYYEIRSWHPKTKKLIHRGEQFVVDSSPSRVNVESLLDIVN